MLTKRNRIKICQICGDDAPGFNYTAVSCIPCKLFFRRTVIERKEYVCKYSGECKLTLVNRKECKACRLKLCFAAGMRKEYILNESQCRERLLKQLENKRKSFEFKTNRSNCGIDCSPDASVSSSTIDEQDDFLERLLEDSCDISEFDIQIEVKKLDLDLYDLNHKLNAISDDISQKTSEIERSVMPIIRPISDYTNNFNEYECNKLTELLNATNYLKIEDPGLMFEIKVHNYSVAMELWVNQLETEVRNIVKMCKNLIDFRSVCEYDQHLLLKYATVEISNINLLNGYDWDKDCCQWNLTNNRSMKLDKDYLQSIDKDEAGMIGLYFDRSIQDCLMDQVIIDLLIALVVFNPNRPNLMHRELIKYKQVVYMYLLNRYLLLKYRSDLETNTRFMKLMRNLEIVHLMCKTERERLFENKARFICQPLFREIYDLDLTGIGQK